MSCLLHHRLLQHIWRKGEEEEIVSKVKLRYRSRGELGFERIIEMMGLFIGNNQSF